MDQAWCPKVIRDGATDYLHHVISVTDGYGPIRPLLLESLARQSTNRVIDLCSGGGGPWMGMEQPLTEQNPQIEVLLTDLYGNANVPQRTADRPLTRIRAHPQPVDALKIPNELNGFRTFFSSFHHFSPEQARSILRAAVESQNGIGVFEGTKRTPAALAFMLVVPLLVLLMTPTIRPFRWARLFWTYVIPLIPFVVGFDGFISCLRTYTVAELKSLTEGLSPNGYSWEIGEKSARGLPITYLIGAPNRIAPDSNHTQT
jgi:hypothetical protein